MADVIDWPSNPQVWSPLHPAVEVERDEGTVKMVRHASYPYLFEIASAQGSFDVDGLLFGASEYVKRLYDEFTNISGRDWLPQLWGNASGALKLAWRPLVEAPGREPDDPRDCAWATRIVDSERRDLSVVLVAGLSSRASFLNFGQGIRVVASLWPSTDAGRYLVAITSFLSTLESAVSPSLPIDQIFAVGAGTRKRRLLAMTPLSLINIDLLLSFLAIPQEIVADYGFRFLEKEDGQPVLDVRLITSASDQPGESSQRASYEFIARYDPARDSLALLSKRPLVTSVALETEIYPTDPVTSKGLGTYFKYRPNKSSLFLNDARDNATIGGLIANGPTIKLANMDGEFMVLNSEFVDEDKGTSINAPKEVESPLDPDVRTNAFAAANALFHVDALFKRLKTCGIPAQEYFRFVSLPVLVRYRAGIIPGPGRDGRTINAQVVWNAKPTEGTPKGTVEARFALGDLQSSPHRSPLGCAADQRWCWHEFSHVLIAAATGELEFRFGHSAGDALGAIICDPDSAIRKSGDWRGVTFPWLDLPARRHDRKVADGWSWSGLLYRPEKAYPYGLSDRRGYWAEQLLSSSLFRLYRAMGGDSEWDNVSSPFRTVASEYALYLIIKATQLLGPAAQTPVDEPNEFVTALFEADIAMQNPFIVTPKAPYNGPPIAISGGTALKVIRWAFEKQGLYVSDAGGNSGSSGATVGGVPPVDVYFKSDRDLPPPHESGTPDEYGPGEYQPVGLEGAAWHASPSALWCQQSPHHPYQDQGVVALKRNYVFARVRNRGSQWASDVRVNVWFAPKNAAGAPYPEFPGNVWTYLSPDGKHHGDIAAGSEAVFGPFVWPPQPQGDYVLLASATCLADRANIDPNTNLPCATNSGRLEFLVACDNNLGLRDFHIS
jgi:hypothetical protein